VNQAHFFTSPSEIHAWAGIFILRCTIRAARQENSYEIQKYGELAVDQLYIDRRFRRDA
jgi:hypothetical protein